MTRPLLRFGPDDVARANTLWSANCGPVALAAALGLTLDAVQSFVGRDFERSGYMNQLDMVASIHRAGFSAREIAPVFPRHGVVRIQWGGPWMLPGVPFGWKFKHTHWIASIAGVPDRWVFDVNAPDWMPYEKWRGAIAPVIMATVDRCDGKFNVANSYEIRRRREEPPQ